MRLVLLLTMLLSLPDGAFAGGRDAACVRLDGWIGQRAEALVRARLSGPEAMGPIFDEAGRAFSTCYDDQHPTNIPPRGEKGLWQGEYWGKTVLSMVGYVRYSGDRQLQAFVEDKALKLIREHQRPDGYLGTYRDADFVVGWNWNVWNRKYTLWALVEVCRLTGNREILAAAEKLVDHLVGQLDRLGVSLSDTGCFVGMPSMSILKPLLLLYEETKEPRYLALARQIVALNDRADGAAPNLIANAFGDKPVHAWYPDPGKWAKAYELMSVLEGFVEFSRVTGERRPLEAARRIWSKLAADELNVLGGVGLKDHFMQAAATPNALTELCDVIHWMRLNRFLYEATGEMRCLDLWERAFLNAFMAGVNRDGSWAAFAVRGHGHRHHFVRGEIGMSHHFCCLDNAPRAFWDYADCQVRVTDAGVEVNFYTDAEWHGSGLDVTLSGGYPQAGEVTVKIVSDRPRSVAFRVPDWARGTMRVDGEPTRGDRAVRTVVAGATSFKLQFDLAPRVEQVVLRKPVGDSDLAHVRDESFELWWSDVEMKGLARREAGQVRWKGPLLQVSCGGKEVDYAEMAGADSPTGPYFSVFLPESDGRVSVKGHGVSVEREEK